MSVSTGAAANLKLPVNLLSRDFHEHKLAYYRWLREESPVHRGKLSVLTIYMLSRYQDCVDILKDKRFIRNRATATGGGARFPFPMPKSVSLLAEMMITEDGAEHRRLRDLVHKAFIPRRLAALEGRITEITDQLLDAAQSQDQIDLIPAYAHPIPVTVIAEMVGVPVDEVPKLARYVNTLSSGFSGFRVAKTMFWDMPGVIKYARRLIARKRKDPQDDILTGLIEAQEGGDRLSEDELVSMLLLLIIAGHETTVHLITNSVQTLLEYPDQLDRLRAEPELMDTAIEETLRFKGPVQATKPMYLGEDVTMHDVVIPKGKPIMPLLGAGNFDETVFEDPETFDIARSPNRHLGFGQGIHYCLGAPLARMETKIALRTLLERCPNLQLAVPTKDLKVQNFPGWHRYQSLPVRLR